MQNLQQRLNSLCPELKMEEKASMKEYTSFKAGGEAALLAEPSTLEELKYLLIAIDDEKIPFLLLGNGSNTLFKDEGYEGVVIKLAPGSPEFDFIDIGEPVQGKASIKVGTALLMSKCAKAIAEAGFTGFEPLSGIPGSLGGAVFMNAGAYGGEMSMVVKEVKAISRGGSRERIFKAEEMDFGYRHSILEEKGWIATSLVLELEKGDKAEINAAMKDFTDKRNSKQPLAYPSAGSTFKRPAGYFAGKLIEDSGLKGVSVGGAQVSTLHSGFVINKGGATATDILQLISLIQNTVYDKFGVELEPEVRIIG